jgi:hypothetical protein
MAVQPASVHTPPPLADTRVLEGLEHAMCLTDEVAPFSVVAVLRLAGTLPASTLRTALDTLQQRHPLLRARLQKEGTAYAYHFDCAKPIPLDVCERVQPDSWMAAAQDALHHRFDQVTGPLMRCRYLVDQRGGDLIVTIPHHIVDAESAANLFRELLALCTGQTLDATVDTTQEGRVPAPALYPKAFTGLGYARAVAAMMGRQMVDEMAFRWQSRGVRKAPIFETGRCCILPLAYPAALTDALIQASRRERVTLNSILSAAMLQAVQRRLYRSPRVPLRHIIFTDMRSRLRTPVPATILGCFLTMFRFTVLVEHDGGFWDLARAVQDSTVRAARSGERYLAFSMAPSMMKMIFTMKAFRMGATALSYAGAVDFPVIGGAFEVTGVHAFAANMTLGPEYSALIRLFHGELCWDILYLDSDMDAVLATQIADDIRTILEEATC